MAGSVVGSPTSIRTRPRSSTPPSVADPPPLRCCCGSLLCDVLRHNCSVLESVENDVQMAAKLGQALLIRHEALMAQTDRDAARYAARIHDLEAENERLSASNDDMAARNRGLERDLGALNIRVAESDARVKELEADLEVSREAARRFEAQTGELDRHIVAVEEEVVRLQASLAGEREEGKGAVRRWRVAERRINDLQDELERMEALAREERERQAEIIDRMEAQRAVERELSSAAGRLKGAAAAKTLGLGPDQEGGSNKVVSQFVRDLLQDNAGLQVAVAELRELLANSSSEIQTLRERLAQYQPPAEAAEAGAGVGGTTLQAELGSEISPPPSREVHIHHHHYHVPPKPEPKKPRKRRHGHPPFSKGPDSPRYGSMRGRWEARMPAVASPHSEFFSAKASTVDSDVEWPVPSGVDEGSNGPASSVSSSPTSNARNSMFDHGLADPSSPVSPTTSMDPLSPAMKATGGKHLSNASIGSALGAALETSRACAAEQSADQMSAIQAADVVEESQDETRQLDEIEDEILTHTTATPRPEITLPSEARPSPPALEPFTPRPPPLRRTVSHESVMSLAGGLDIHTLKSRPSQLTLCRHGGAQAMAIVTGVTAEPTITCASPGLKGGASLLMGSLASVSATSPSGRSEAGWGGGGSLRAVSGPLQGLGSLKWKGWKPWGRSLSPGVGREGGSAEEGGSNNNEENENEHENSGTPETSQSRQQPRIEVSPSPTESRGRGKVRDVLRAPGINQPGAIPGFQEYLAVARRRGPPSRVRAENVDREALRDIFEDSS